MSEALWDRDGTGALLAWLPDETLFSLCSRHHRLSGRGVSAETTQVLFGHRSGGSQHDFPNRIGEFCRRTGGAYGQPDHVARDRTALSFYAPFSQEEVVKSAAREMCGPSVAHLKFRLGLLTSRFGANHPLKACSYCMDADLDRYGWVFWHQEHQLPGVWVCPAHLTPLRVAAVKSTGVGRFLWHLPSFEKTSSSWADGHDLASFVRLADVVAKLVRQPRPDGWLEPSVVQLTLRGQMENRGWVTPSGSIRLEAAAEDFRRFSAPLRIVHELNSLPDSLVSAKTQIGRLLRPLRAGVHPLRLLVCIAWLFEDPEHFIAAHDRRVLLPPAQADHGADGGIAEAVASPQDCQDLPMRARLLQQLGEGKSISAVANTMGVDVSTAISWAAQAGVQTPRRPKLLKPEVRSGLVAKLRRGADKDAVARSAGVSIETVTRLLRSEVGLHAEWQASRFSDAQNRARDAWTQVWISHSAAGAKLMRAMAPAAFAWLYRNDREWLCQHGPSSAAPRGVGGASSVKWDVRDGKLSQAVKEAILQLSVLQARGTLRLWQIYQVVPDLKAKLGQLDRLPLTRRVLEEAISRRAGSTLQPTLFD